MVWCFVQVLLVMSDMSDTHTPFLLLAKKMNVYVYLVEYLAIVSYNYGYRKTKFSVSWLSYHTSICLELAIQNRKSTTQPTKQQQQKKKPQQKILLLSVCCNICNQGIGFPEFLLWSCLSYYHCISTCYTFPCF